MHHFYSIFAVLSVPNAV